MSMGHFESDLRAFGIKTEATFDKVRRASILELFKLIIYSTPVDSGRLRGNWQTAVNDPAGVAIDRDDKNGALALAEAMANLGGMLDTVWFTNNLPYAERIEYDGWSYKEPEGMVRKHLAQWQRIVRAKARYFANQ